MRVCVLFLVLMFAVESAAESKDLGSYNRIKHMARLTEAAQPVLYYANETQKPAVLQFVSTLKSHKVKLPHLVDVSKADDATKAEVRQSMDRELTEPVLHTVHSTGLGYGPRWLVAKEVTPIEYTAWLAECAEPAVYVPSNYTYYNYTYRSRGRGFSRRR